jgi:macrolide transport system ATP-binding/permease protein
MDTLVQDLRYAVRGLAKAPGFTAVVILTFALGIGANVAIFGVVNALLLRPLPVRAPEQIIAIAIQQKGAPIGSGGFSYPELEDFRRQSAALSDVFGMAISPLQLADGDRSEQCFGNYVTSNFFSSLGVQPAVGRLLLPSNREMDNGPLFVVIGYGYWQRRFHGDPSIIDRQIRIGGKPATIVGVASRTFQGMYSGFETDVYLPLAAITAEEPPDLFWNRRDVHRILAFGRMAPGATLAEVQSSLDVISDRLAKEYPATDKWYTVRAVPERLARPIPYANKAFVTISGIFLLLALFVLLLACLNVENLLLVRGSTRHREMAIRTALGAAAGRLIRQMITETMLLAMLGAGVGMMSGYWFNRVLKAVHLQDIPLHLDATFDWRVFIFAVGATLLGGIAVGVLPAVRAASADVNVILHGGQHKLFGMHQAGVRNFLVVAQVGGALTLLIVGGLFVRSMQSAQHFDLGFDPRNLLNVTIDSREAGYNDLQGDAFFKTLEAKVSALPGVKSTSSASYVPLGGFPTKAPVSLSGHPKQPGEQAPSILFNVIDPPYFATLHIALRRGRNFADADNREAPPVAIINNAMEQRFWPREDAVGKRFSINGDAGPFLTVIGVVNDGKYQSVGEDAQPFFYISLNQNFVPKRVLQIRTVISPELLIAPVKSQISALNPAISALNIETMEQSLEGAFGFFAFRLAAGFASTLGLIGLFLGVTGVFGVVSYSAQQRTREIGIRVALGAQPRDILLLVWRQGVRLVVGGITLGLGAAWILTKSMAHLLVGVATGDMLTYAAAAVTLLLIGVTACWIPARRATRLAPAVILRSE